MERNVCSFFGMFPLFSGVYVALFSFTLLMVILALSDRSKSIGHVNAS